MKTLFALTIGAVAVTFLSQSSFAGPEPLESKTVAPRMVEPLCDWTGFYVGVHVGYGSGESTWKDVDFGGNTELGHQSHEGVFGGGQLGYNFQFGHFVIGAEGDFAYSDVGGEKTNPFQFSPTFIEFHTINTDNDWTGTAAARLGYAFADSRVLAYVKGGGAFSHWNYNFVNDSPSDGQLGTVNTFNTDDTRITPMVGVGVEFAINCRWSAKLEARYVFHGKENVVGTLFEKCGPACNDTEPNESYQVDLRQVSAQVGLNYKLW